MLDDWSIQFAGLGGRSPDLLVLGWHRHALPLPEQMLHQAAWRLSTSFPRDVLLVPASAAE